MAKKTPQILTTDMYNDVIAQMKADGINFNFLDYDRGDKYSMKILDIEFDVLSTTKFGGNEGIYTSLFLQGNFGQHMKNITQCHIGTFKTLYTDDEHFLQMAELGARFQLYSGKWIDKNEELLCRTGVRIDMYKSDGTKSCISLICASKERAEYAFRNNAPYKEWSRATLTDMYTGKVIKEITQEEMNYDD